MAFCTECGAQIPDHTQFCTECGKPVGGKKTVVRETPAPPVPPAPENNLPPVRPQPPSRAGNGNREGAPPFGSPYAVLSVGSYIGLTLLFMLPLIGLIACGIIAFTSQNRNRRNYARAMLVLLLIGILLAAALYFIFAWIWKVVVEYYTAYLEDATGGAMEGIKDLDDLFGILADDAKPPSSESALIPAPQASIQAPGAANTPAAQASGAPQSAGGSGTNADGQAIASLIAWMRDGTFSYDFTMTSDGTYGSTASTGSMALDGESMAITQEMTMEGQRIRSRIIVTDGDIYIVDDENEFIMKAPGGMNPLEGLLTDYSGIEKTGEGIGEAGGKTLPYEEYTEGETGATVRYYLEGSAVYAMESEYEGTTTLMIITNASNSVPNGVFDLPEGYMTM